MVSKPEKKKFDEKLGYDAETNIKCIAIHNQACDDYEKWLSLYKPDWKAIEKIIEKYIDSLYHNKDCENIIAEKIIFKTRLKGLAKAIAEGLE